MPGAPHEVLILAIRDQPGILNDLATKVTCRSPPAGHRIVDAATRFTQSIELRPDLVLRSPKAGWVIAEIQNHIDPKKLRTWPLARNRPRSPSLTNVAAVATHRLNGEPSGVDQSGQASYRRSKQHPWFAAATASSVPQANGVAPKAFTA